MSTTETLAELLFHRETSAERAELERYRIKYEKIHGPTDLTKRYTSTWPLSEQKWLMENHPEEYFNGLPPFATDFIKRKLEAAAKDGDLDQESDVLVRLYVNGTLRNSRGR